MPEYDAFGREKSEGIPAPPAMPAPPAAPLAGPPQMTPAPRPAMPPAMPAAPAAFGRRRRGPGTALVGIVFFLLLGGGLVGLVAVGGETTSTSSSPSFDPIVTKSSKSSEDLSPSAPAKPAEPPTGLQAGSLIRRDQLTPALRTLRTSGLGRLTGFLRIASDRIDATLLTKDGRLRNVQIVPGGGLHRISLTGPAFSGSPTMPFSDLDPAGPERLVRAATRRLHASASAVNYLVVSRFGSEVHVRVYFKNGASFQGDRAGNLQRRFS